MTAPVLAPVDDPVHDAAWTLNAANRDVLRLAPVSAQLGQKPAPLVPIEIHDLLNLDIKPRRMFVAPIIPGGGFRQDSPRK
jgi:hypothetical protein